MENRIMKHNRIFAIFGLVVVAALLAFPFGSFSTLQTVGAQAPSQSTPGANPALQPTPPPIGGGGQIPSPNGVFSNLTFSTAADGPAIANFPAGTQSVFARFDYANIQPGGTLARNWYLNGQPYLSRSEAWNPAYGTNGRITNISIFDYNGRLPSGNYTVTIFLVGTNVYISGAFTVAGGVVYPTATPINPPNTGAYFTNITTSTSAAGAAASVFPAGTRAVHVRFNYANIPVGTLFRREWFRDGQLIRTAQDVWSAYWGSNGRLTHISLFDYTYGLTAGNYRVLLSLPYLNISYEISFTIQAGVPTGGYFSNLTFSTAVSGPAYSYFYAYTREIFARWRYVNVPYGSVLVRRWYRDGVLYANRREGWYRSGSGTVYASIFDYQYGLRPGNYYVEISLEGVPNSTITGSFRVG
jgi:hypothetical protein